MKIFLSLILMVSLSVCFAGFEGKNNGASLDVFNKINCGPSVECTKTARGIFNIADSGIKTQVAATATTILASQCGSTFINTGAVQMELPEASSVLGCRLTFIVDDASNFDINPDDADTILVATNAAGDAIRTATRGNTIVLESSSSTAWSQVSFVGTWTDIN